MASTFVFVMAEGRTVAFPSYSFSNGWSRYQRDEPLPPPSSNNLKLHGLPTNKRPGEWSGEELITWLRNEGCREAVTASFEAALMDGEATIGCCSENIDSLTPGLKLGERIRLKDRIQCLAMYNQELQQQQQRQQQQQQLQSKLENSSLNIMLAQSSVTVQLTRWMLADTKIDEVVLVCYHKAERNGYGRNREKVPKQFEREAFYAIHLRNASLSSLQESGSSENPTVSMSFLYDVSDLQIHHKGIQDFSSLGGLLMARQLGVLDEEKAAEMEKEDPVSLVTAQSLIYSRAFKCWERVQYGDQMVWSTQLHKVFPAEMRAIVREMIFLFRSRNNPLLTPVSKDVLFLIFKHLARSYCTKSPLDRWPMPSYKNAAEREENDDN